jgi:hypothetical protein
VWLLDGPIPTPNTSFIDYIYPDSVEISQVFISLVVTEKALTISDKSRTSKDHVEAALTCP